MTHAVRVLLAAVVAALAAAALAAPGGAANECRGILVCISVPGPWVYVPASGEATYLLECPRRRGVVGGLDALSTSRDVRVTFDARTGSPVAPGTTTGRDAFFRGVSARHRVAQFQPYLGCIPAGGGGGRSTTSANAVVRPGVPFERRARNVKLGRVSTLTATQKCAKGERLVGGWHALAFRVKTPPEVGIARLVKIQRTVRNGAVSVRILTNEGVPAAAHAEVQVGAVCAT
jgi:hypothetical protein